MQIIEKDYLGLTHFDKHWHRNSGSVEGINNFIYIINILRDYDRRHLLYNYKYKTDECELSRFSLE